MAEEDEGERHSQTQGASKIIATTTNTRTPVSRNIHITCAHSSALSVSMRYIYKHYIHARICMSTRVSHGYPSHRTAITMGNLLSKSFILPSQCTHCQHHHGRMVGVLHTESSHQRTVVTIVLMSVFLFPFLVRVHRIPRHHLLQQVLEYIVDVPIFLRGRLVDRHFVHRCELLYLLSGDLAFVDLYITRQHIILSSHLPALALTRSIFAPTTTIGIFCPPIRHPPHQSPLFPSQHGLGHAPNLLTSHA